MTDDRVELGSYHTSSTTLYQRDCGDLYKLQNINGDPNRRVSVTFQLYREATRRSSLPRYWGIA